jgi:hypothetical protein
MAVRRGEVAFDDLMAEIDEVERRVGVALATTRLPDEPDRPVVDEFLVGAYRRAWGWD